MRVEFEKHDYPPTRKRQAGLYANGCFPAWAAGIALEFAVFDPMSRVWILSVSFVISTTPDECASVEAESVLHSPMPPLSEHLFWDVDRSSIDLERHVRWLVKRVLEYGRWRDWQTIVAHYGKPRRFGRHCYRVARPESPCARLSAKHGSTFPLPRSDAPFRIRSHCHPQIAEALGEHPCHGRLPARWRHILGPAIWTSFVRGFGFFHLLLIRPAGSGLPSGPPGLHRSGALHEFPHT